MYNNALTKIKHIMSPITYDEIVHNFGIMEETITKGRGYAIDLGFIEIFEKAINDLQKADYDKDKLKTLKARLAANENAIKTSSPVGKIVSLSDFHSKLDEGYTKTGLEMLEPHFNFRKIAGDGHCFFRAIAQGIIDLGDEEKRNLFEKVEADKLIRDAFNKETATYTLVRFMRELACKQMQGSQDKAYLQKMRDDAYGGEAEWYALTQALDLDIRIVDAHVVAKKQQTPESYLEGSSNKTIFLLLTPDHYDLVYPK